MNKSDIITRKMLSVIRESSKALNEDTVRDSDNLPSSYPILKSDAQFKDIREDQIQKIIQTIGESIHFEDNALMYYPQTKDMTLTGEITALRVMFQFRLSDTSGEGCFIWTKSNGEGQAQDLALQLTENNLRTVGKIRDAFLNWKQSLMQDGDLMNRIDDSLNRN